MMLGNKYNAALILLLHASLIAMGMIVAYFIPLTEDPSTFCHIRLDSLIYENHSDAELLSWLNFLELPHEETLVGKDTLSETLDKSEVLGKLDFFSNVAATDHVDYLADRISASADEDVPYRWKITLQDASREDAYAVFSALHTVQQQKFSDQAAAHVPPIEILGSRFGGVDSISPSDDRLVQFGKACPPAVGALLAVILGMVAWSLFMPGQRKLSLPGSIDVLLTATIMLSLVGAGIGYLYTAKSGGQWESELTVQTRRSQLLPLANLTPEAQSLTAKLRKKLDVEKIYFLNEKSVVEELVHNKRMATWGSFQKILNTKGNGTDEGDSVDSNLLVDYIIDRLEVEQAPDASDVFTVRFRSEDKKVSRALLACLVDYYSAKLGERNRSLDKDVESVGVVGQLTRKYEINRLSNPTLTRVVRPWIASGYTFQGALTGAIFTLVIVSSTRVLAGAPPI